MCYVSVLFLFTELTLNVQDQERIINSNSSNFAIVSYDLIDRTVPKMSVTDKDTLWNPLQALERETQ
jgi:hypothetical protein